MRRALAADVDIPAPRARTTVAARSSAAPAALPFARMEAAISAWVSSASGTMGAGIAQVLLEGGLRGGRRATSTTRRSSARAARIEGGLNRRVEKGQRSEDERRGALERLTLVRELGGLSGCQLVIEAIVEEIGAKRRCSPSSTPSADERRGAREQHVRHLGDGDRRGQRAGPSAASGCTSSTRRR